jgi:hypothetical protein
MNHCGAPGCDLFMKSVSEVVVTMWNSHAARRPPRGRWIAWWNWVPGLPTELEYVGQGHWSSPEGRCLLRWLEALAADACWWRHAPYRAMAGWTDSPKEGATGQQQHKADSEGMMLKVVEEVLQANVVLQCLHKGCHRHNREASTEWRKWWDTCRLLRMSSCKEGEMWHGA